MAETFEDLSLRQVLSGLGFDEPERSVHASTKTGMLHIPEITASIHYKFDNGISISGNPFTTKKLKRHEKDCRVSLEDHLEYEKANKDQNRELRRQEREFNREYKEAMKVWKQKYPNYRRSKKGKGIPMAEIERPTKRQVGFPVGGVAHHLGILIESYEDKECLTAKLKSATVRYVHEDGIMNYEKLKETTDLTKEDLVKIRAELCEKYNVSTGCKGGQWEEEKWPGVMVPIPTPKKYQNNVFTAELTSEMELEEMIAAINNVYRAGEAFKKGLYSLQEERTAREEHEKAVEAGRQKSVMDKF